MFDTLPKIALVGRPNVGKSTLFNRLVGRRVAIVHDQPGVTRDRREGDVNLFGLKFKIIDTAGLEDPNITVLTSQIEKQTLRAIQESSATIYMLDGKVGLTPYDYSLANLLRKQNKPIIVVMNKCESNNPPFLHEAYQLKFGDIIPLSAEHGLGIDELFDALNPLIPSQEDEKISEEVNQKPITLSIIGKPNVGKSTLVNALIGENRLITSDMPGVTRDSISIEWIFEGTPIKLIDTAGIRTSAKVKNDPLETLSVQDAKKNIKYSDSVILLLDGSKDSTNPIDKNELQLASYVIKEGRSLIIGINKWDQQREKDKFLDELKHILNTHLSQTKDISFVPISALQKKNLRELISASVKNYELWNVRIPTSKLNPWLQHITQLHPPPIVKGTRIKLKYMTQIKSRPPSFVIFCSKAIHLPESYVRYVINNLRKDFNLPSVPIRVTTKSSANPYDLSNKK